MTKKQKTDFEPITFGEETILETILGFLKGITIKRAIALVIVSIAVAIVAWAHQQFNLSIK